MRKVLLLVHVEEMFRTGGWLDDGTVEQILQAIASREFDHVIHFSSYVQDDGPVEELLPHVDQQIFWGWGYDYHHDMDEDERKWTIFSSGHEYTWIPPELRNGQLDNTEVSLGGGGMGECLADMESVLEEMDIPYRLRGKMCY